MGTMSVSATTGILTFLTLLCDLQCLRAAEAVGGELEFVTLSSPTTLPSSDDAFSGPISTSGDFLFGYGTISSVYVSTNGYISMGAAPLTTEAPSLPGTENIVSPYGAAIDSSIAGSVKYIGFTSSHQDMGTVSAYIRLKIGGSFRGTRMMAVEWNGVAQHDGTSSTTNTFQAVLITDDISSFAVFIYRCGGMGWGGANIGWQDSISSYYERHFLSGPDSANVFCEFFSSYSSILYRLSSSEGCALHQFSCDDGSCIYYYDICNGIDNCQDKSDEQICKMTIPSPVTSDETSTEGQGRGQTKSSAVAPVSVISLLLTTSLTAALS